MVRGLEKLSQRPQNGAAIAHKSLQARYKQLLEGGSLLATNLDHQKLGRAKIRHVTEGDEAYMSVVLVGVIPGSTAPGNYYCKYLHFLVPGGKWVLVFENLELAIKVVDGPPAHREREGAWLYGVRFLG